MSVLYNKYLIDIKMIKFHNIFNALNEDNNNFNEEYSLKWQQYNIKQQQI